MTGIAYDDLLALAEEQYPPFPVNFPDGVTVNLRSSLDLTDEDAAKLAEIQKSMGEMNETSNLTELRDEFSKALVLVSDDPAEAQVRFGSAPLKVLIVLFTKYNEALSEATKSEGSAQPTS